MKRQYERGMLVETRLTYRHGELDTNRLEEPHEDGIRLWDLEDDGLATIELTRQERRPLALGVVFGPAEVTYYEAAAARPRSDLGTAGADSTILMDITAGSVIPDPRHLYFDEQTLAEKAVTVLRRSVAAAAMFGALIGGPGEQMPAGEQRELAVAMAEGRMDTLTPEGQFMQLYLGGGPTQDDQIGTFDDTSNSSMPKLLWNLQLGRLWAEEEYQVVRIGSACLNRGDFNIIPNAKDEPAKPYTSEDELRVVSSSGQALTFDIESGKIAPRDDGKTLEILDDAGCPAGLQIRLGKEQTWVVPFETLATSK